jgi:hypothetical protein
MGVRLLLAMLAAALHATVSLRSVVNAGVEVYHTDTAAPAIRTIFP